MSECVVRMEMPKLCSTCPIRIDCEVYRRWLGSRRRTPPKPQDKGCQILAVLPENHGRMVDADAFISTIRPLCEEDKFTACTLETAKRMTVEHINNAPTIVPADTAERRET